MRKDNKKWIVCNGEFTKGVIIEATDADDARKLANDRYYSPFARKNDLCVVQVYEPEKHLFISAEGNKQFGFVQYHIMGGVTTSYNVTIDTPMTKEQQNFLKNEPIGFIKFYMNQKDSY